MILTGHGRGVTNVLLGVSTEQEDYGGAQATPDKLHKTQPLSQTRHCSYRLYSPGGYHHRGGGRRGS